MSHSVVHPAVCTHSIAKHHAFSAQMAQRERAEEAARAARRATMRAEMAESNRQQLQLKVHSQGLCYHCDRRHHATTVTQQLRGSARLARCDPGTGSGAL